MSTKRLAFKEKFAYGLGDAGCNIVWQTAMLFLAYFYTDIYGLSPAHMGTMFLAVRFIDAVTDPIMGSIVDRTKTKLGRYRPYIAIFAIPFGIACTMVFYTPDLSYTGKLIYAYVSYIFLTLMYTALNVPYCALSNAMTEDSNERTSLQSFRFTLNTIVGLMVAFLALPLVDLIGGDNKQVGYLGAIGIMSLLAVIMFFSCFFGTKERYTPVSSNQNSFADLKKLVTSQQWIVSFLANALLLVAILVKNSTTLYYVNNVMHRPDLATILMTIPLVFAVAGAIVCPYLFNRFEKSYSYMGLIAASGIISAALFFVEPTNITMIFVLAALYGFVQMMTSPLIWSMMSDLADYESYRIGKTMHGIVFATILFAIKLGIAVGGAMVGWILAGVGYSAGLAEQSVDVNNMINLLFTVIPGILMVLVALILIPYKLNKAKMLSINGSK